MLIGLEQQKLYLEIRTAKRQLCSLYSQIHKKKKKKSVQQIDFDCFRDTKHKKHTRLKKKKK